VAAKLDLHPSTLYKILAGDRQPDARTLGRLLICYPESRPYVVQYLRHRAQEA
jgi:predicted transcriptional regulator